MFRKKSMVALALAGLIPAAFAAESIKLDLTKAQKGAWAVKPVKEFSDAELLTGRGTSAPIPFTVSEAGRHFVYVIFAAKKDKLGNFRMLIRDEQGEVIRQERVDFLFHPLSNTKPYEERKFEREQGLFPAKIEVDFEYPGTYTMTFSDLIRTAGPGQGGGIFIDSVFVTSDPAFDTAKAKDLKPQTAGKTSAAAPAGFQPAPVFPLSTELYGGITDKRKRFKLGLLDSWPLFYDLGNFVRMGATNMHGYVPEAEADLLRYGMNVIGGRGVFAGVGKNFTDAHPSPEGRFINREGKVGRNFSDAYGPYREALSKAMRTHAENIFKSKSFLTGAAVDGYSVAGEGGGSMDYSPASQEKFRLWLKEKYKTIDKLNEAWHASFKDFSEIKAAESPEVSKCCFLEFREFSGNLFCEMIAEKVRLIAELDPMKRSATAQFSNFDFGAVGYSLFRPVDIESLILDGMKDADNFAWDGYCADDFMGWETDMAYSFARGKKKLYQREFNTHSEDWRIAARTFWTLVGKGVRAIELYMYGGAGFSDSYPKWGLTTHKLEPRRKLYAFSDAMHEVHHLENILVDARRVYMEKPVAIYFSRIDNSLQGKSPYASWGEQADSPYRVYEMLRSRGYSVTAITPRQIRDGLLKDVSAVVLVDAKHIAADVCGKLMDWTKKGGVMIADSWPGGYNDLGFSQGEMLDFFGVKPLAFQKVDSLKLEQSTEGYGDMTYNAINPDSLPTSVLETWQQPYAKHPIVEKFGTFMFSGYGRQKIACTAGEIVAMSFGGPGLILREHGKGVTLYVNAMLGTLYGGSATRYEWDSTHQANDPARILDVFLEHAGVKKTSSTDLRERVGEKLRVEVPLMDTKGNAVITLESFNDDFVRPFELRVAWAKRYPAPQKVYAVVGGSREVREVPFKVENSQLVVSMPSFDTHATVITVQNALPIVSLKFPDAKRNEMNLLDFVPDQTEKVIVKVFNPSPKALAKGTVTPILPPGWFVDKVSAALPEIAPFGSAETVFTVRAPAACSRVRARPLSFVYSAGNVKSMPATELIRWKKK